VWSQPRAGVDTTRTLQGMGLAIGGEARVRIEVEMEKKGKGVVGGPSGKLGEKPHRWGKGVDANRRRS